MQEGINLYSGSFIFSFENDQDIHNMKIGKVINETCAISMYEYCKHFFNFGNHLYVYNPGQNLYLNNNGNYDNILYLILI